MQWSITAVSSEKALHPAQALLDNDGFWETSTGVPATVDAPQYVHLCAAIVPGVELQLRPKFFGSYTPARVRIKTKGPFRGDSNQPYVVHGMAARESTGTGWKVAVSSMNLPETPDAIEAAPEWITVFKATEAVHQVILSQALLDSCLTGALGKY